MPISDRAIRNKEEDMLSRKPFIDRLTTTLIDIKTSKSTGIIAGIVGDWGCGKTSILNLLEKHIKQEYKDAIIVRFDPWIISGRDDLIQCLLKQLISSMEKRGLKETITEAMKKYSEGLKMASAFLKPGLEKNIQGYMESKEDIHLLRDKLDDILSTIEIPIIVIIDEVDRIEDNEVHMVAQLVRAVVDFSGISYVLAYDDRRVSQILGRGDEPRGREYLEKIVQIPISVPLLLPAEIVELLLASLRDIFNGHQKLLSEFDEPRFKQLNEFMVPEILRTPRDIKRTVGVFCVFFDMLGQEVDASDLLAFSALTTKAPRTVDMIRKNYALYINDYWRDSDFLAHQKEQERKPEDIKDQRIHSDERSVAVENLMGFIFPVLDFSGRSQNRETTSQSLCRYRPLLMALRLGLFPKDYPTDEIQDLITKPSDEITDVIKSKVQEDDFPLFWDRLCDVYTDSKFESATHDEFWEGMRKFTMKSDGKFPDGYSAMKDLNCNVSKLFFQKFCSMNESVRDDGNRILLKLFNEGDVEISPGIVRRHIHMYGIYGWEARSSEKFLMTKDETELLAKKIVDRELPRLLNGRLLSNLWRPDVLFLIKDVQGDLSEECRSYFDSLVDDDATLPGVSLFFNGLGYINSAESLDAYFDLEKFKSRVKKFLDDDEANQIQLDSAIKISYERVMGK